MTQTELRTATNLGMYRMTRMDLVRLIERHRLCELGISKTEGNCLIAVAARSVLAEKESAA